MNKTPDTRSSLVNFLLSPYASLICAALFWSGNFIVGRALKGSVDPVPLNFWRWTVALVLLLPSSYAGLLRHRAIIRSHWKLIAALGFTGIAAFHTCVYQALTQTTAINALIILSTSPMVIVLLSWAFFREGIRAAQGLGLLVSFLGALVLISRGDVNALYHFEFNRGDLWMGVAVPLWAAYSILLRKAPRELPQLLTLTSSVVAGVIFMVPALGVSLYLGQRMPVTPVNVMALLYISIFASVLAFFCWNRGVASIGPVRAGIYIHFMPLFGAVLSIWFLNEGIALYHLAGALLVGIGIVLTNRPGRKDAPAR